MFGLKSSLKKVRCFGQPGRSEDSEVPMEVECMFLVPMTVIDGGAKNSGLIPMNSIRKIS